MRRLVARVLIGLGMTTGAGAADITSGDWTWNVDDPEAYYAATANSAGQVLMQLCNIEDHNCVYMVGFDLSCKAGDSYSALVKTDDGAAGIELLCGSELDAGGNLMLVADFDQIDGMIRKAKKIGFALPMEGDEFKAVRFALKGAVPALDAMRKLAARGNERKPGVRNAKDSEVF